MFGNVYLSAYECLQPNICLLTSVRLVFCICSLQNMGKKIKVDFLRVSVRFSKTDGQTGAAFSNDKSSHAQKHACFKVMADMLSGFL